MKHRHLIALAFAGLAVSLSGCGGATPPAQTVASNNTTPQHGSGGGTGAHGHRKEHTGNKDGLPGGTTHKHGSGEGGGRNSEGKVGQALGNKDGHPGGTSTEHGSGHGGGRGGGHKAHAGDKNGKPGPQTDAKSDVKPTTPATPTTP